MIKHTLNMTILDLFVTCVKHPTSGELHAHVDLDAYLRAVGVPVTPEYRQLVMNQIVAAREAAGKPLSTASVINNNAFKEPDPETRKN